MARAYAVDEEDDSEEDDEEMETDSRAIHPAQMILPGVEHLIQEPQLEIEYDLSLDHLLSGLPKSDRPLVREAIDMGCEVYLTTDAGVLREAQFIENWTGLRIRKLTEFLDEVLDTSVLGCGSREGDLWPDLELLTEMIA